MTVIGEFLGIPKWRKDHRSNPRADKPTLSLTASWRRLDVLDWSLGGCSIAAAPGAYKVGDQIEGRLEVDGAGERGDFVAEVIRATEAGELELRWLEVSVHLFAEMASVKSS